VGTFMAFDRHMNMVLGDTEEYRRIKAKKGTGISEDREEKRTLGLIVLRGDSIVSLTIEGPPPPDDDDKVTAGGPGLGRAAGRGLPIAPLAGAPMGLGGPIRGVGGPAASMMQPAAQGMLIEHIRINLNLVSQFTFFSRVSSRCPNGCAAVRPTCYAPSSWNARNAQYVRTPSYAPSGNDDGHASSCASRYIPTAFPSQEPFIYIYCIWQHQ